MSAEATRVMNRQRGWLDSDTRLSVTAFARRYTQEAVETIVGVMQDPEASHRDRLTAAQVILDRAWGKPLASVDVKVNDARDIPSLTRDVLLALAAGQVTDVEIEMPVSETVDATG